MGELEKLFGDNIDAVITLYRCCKPNVSKVVVLNTLEPKNMTQTEKMYITKFTKIGLNNLIVINWKKLMIDTPTSKSIAKVWDILKREIDGLNVKKDLRRKSIDPKYFEGINYLPTEKFDRVIDRNDFALDY